MSKALASFLSICMAFCVVIFSQCKKSNDRECFKSKGKTVKEERPVSAYDKIILDGEINLIITQDSVYDIAVEAPDNLINFIKTEITDTCLKIKNENKCDFLRSYEYEINVYVSLVDLKEIYFTGSGKITSTNTIKTPLLTLNFWGASGSLDMAVDAVTIHSNIHTGPGDITLSGFAGESYIYSASYGYMHLENLITGYTFAGNNGTGDFYIDAEKEIVATITSLGSVYYKGNPYKIRTDLKGKGEFLRME